MSEDMVSPKDVQRMKRLHDNAVQRLTGQIRAWREKAQKIQYDADAKTRHIAFHLRKLDEEALARERQNRELHAQLQERERELVQLRAQVKNAMSALDTAKSEAKQMIRGLA